MYLFSGATCKMTYSTADPMALRSPSCAKASIRTKRAAKKTKVAHSTLAKTDSTSDLSDITSNDIAPKRATQPRLKFKLGIFCRKNNSTTMTRTTAALTSKSLLVILQDSSSEWMEELWLSPEFSKYFLFSDKMCSYSSLNSSIFAPIISFTEKKEEYDLKCEAFLFVPI